MRLAPGFSARAFSLLLGSLLLAAAEACVAQAYRPSRQDIVHPVFAAQGMVSTQEARATRVGVEVLKGDGNAVDAAVAIGFVLAVTLPEAGNLGGGGFMLIHRAEVGDTLAVDYREAAPAAASRDMYLDGEGQVDTERLRFSHQAVAVPGSVAGLTLALERYGTRPLNEVLAPAIALARTGIVVDRELAISLAQATPHLRRWPEAARVYLKPDGAAYATDELWYSPIWRGPWNRLPAPGARRSMKGRSPRRLLPRCALTEG